MYVEVFFTNENVYLKTSFLKIEGRSDGQFVGFLKTVRLKKKKALLNLINFQNSFVI